MSTRDRMHWDSPYGGRTLRGRDPEKAFKVLDEFRRRFSDQSGWESAELHIQVPAAVPLYHWVKSGPMEQRQVTAMADLLDHGTQPHPVVQRVLDGLGPATLRIWASTFGCEEQTSCFQLEWKTEQEDADFEPRTEQIRALSLSVHGELVEEVPLASANFFLDYGARLTAPDTDDLLPHQDDTGMPADIQFRFGASGFASIPDKVLMLSFTLPFDGVCGAFKSYDAELAKTLGSFSTSRYRRISPGSLVRKVSYKRAKKEGGC